MLSININPKKILKYKKKLENKLKIKIVLLKDSIKINGDAEAEYFGEKIITAIEYDFDFENTLLLTDENYMFEIIDIKDISKRRNMEEVRSRIIGTQGRTLALLQNISNCEIKLRDNNVAILGDVEDVPIVIDALTKLIKGSKQSNVYQFLERRRKESKLLDKGL
ncbi:MAG: hypothetical protein KKF56_04610 [Nanoarchaeota archaeon]|nr:hypothetical protein [Nanoarchaeota archaeon]